MSLIDSLFHLGEGWGEGIALKTYNPFFFSDRVVREGEKLFGSGFRKPSP